MKLRALHIERYRAIRSLDLSFLDQLGRVRPVTVLAGPNGSGKTSVLYAIVQVLRDLAKTPIHDVPAADEFDVHRYGSVSGAVLHEGPAQACVDLELELSEGERRAIAAYHDSDRFKLVRANWPAALDRHFDGRIRLIWEYPAAPVELGTSGPPINLPFTISPSNAHLWILARQVMLGLTSNSSVFAAPLPMRDQIGNLCLFSQDRSLAQHVLGETGPEAPDGTSNPIKKGRRDPDSVTEILKYLSTYATQRDRPLPEAANPEHRIRKQLLALCPPIEYLGYRYQDDDPIGAPYFRNGPAGAVYPLSKAASGLQVILEYLVRLNYPRPLNNSLILIDEPEVHLHPGWARRLYTGLSQLGDGNQFILSTHSAELRAMAAEEGALIDLGDLDAGAIGETGPTAPTGTAADVAEGSQG